MAAAAAAGSGRSAAERLRPASPIEDGELELLAAEEARVGRTPPPPIDYIKDTACGVGLRNGGATCYLNALLQALFAVPAWRRAVFAWRYDADRDGSEDRCIPLQLRRLFARLERSANAACVSTAPLTAAFGWGADTRRVSHDAGELLTVLLEALDSTSLAASAAVVFGGARATTLAPALPADAAAGAAARTDAESFRVLNVPVLGGGDDLGDAVARAHATETLDGENAWRCELLDRRIPATRTTTLATPPRALVLGLHRVTYDAASQSRVRVAGPLSIPDGLDLGAHVAARDCAPDADYDLVAVVNHAGSASGGHYTCLARDAGGAFFRTFDDGRGAIAADAAVARILGRPAAPADDASVAPPRAPADRGGGGGDDAPDGAGSPAPPDARSPSAAALVFYALKAPPAAPPPAPPDDDLAAIATEDAARAADHAREARVERARRRATRLRARLYDPSSGSDGAAATVWASRAASLESATALVAARLGVPGPLHHECARVRMFDVCRNEATRAFDGPGERAESLEALGLAPAADILLEVRELGGPPFARYDPRALTVPLWVWDGADARAAAAALDDGAADALEKRGLARSMLAISGEEIGGARTIAACAASSLGAAATDAAPPPRSLARLRRDLDGIEATSLARRAALFASDELLYCTRAPAEAAGEAVDTLIAVLARRRNALVVKVSLRTESRDDACTVDAATTWTLGDLKRAAIQMMGLRATDEYHLRPPQRVIAPGSRRVDENATLREAGVARLNPPMVCRLGAGPPREPGFWSVRCVLYDARIAATSKDHDAFSSGIKVVAHENATVRDLRSLVAEKLSDMADGHARPVPKRLAALLAAFDTVDIRRVRLRERAPKARYAGRQLRDASSLKKAVPRHESVDFAEVALQIDPKGFDDAGDEGTMAIVLIHRVTDGAVLEVLVDRRATVADFGAVVARQLPDDASPAVGRTGARGKVTWQALATLEQDLPAGRPPYSLLREAAPPLLLRDAGTRGGRDSPTPDDAGAEPARRSAASAAPPASGRGRKTSVRRPRARAEKGPEISVADPASGGSGSASGPRRPAAARADAPPRNSTR